MVKRTILGVALVLGVAGSVAAQTAQQGDAEQVKARQKVFMMEGVLERAVQIGVDSLRQRVRSVMPDDMLLLSGAPQVRGFRLEGYGVLFDVEVPALRRSMAWSLRTMNESSALLARDLAAMRAQIQSHPDERVRVEFERTLRRVQQQVGPVGPTTPEMIAQAPRPGTVSAQTIGTAPALAPLAPLPDAGLLMDPSEAYTQEVKGALIDAMIENSAPLMVGPEEWLTVAARDNIQVDRFMPGDPSEVTTIVLRIKGSDLAAYRAQKITVDEVRTRVDVREF